jgi:hypothetical protein
MATNNFPEFIPDVGPMRWPDLVPEDWDIYWDMMLQYSVRDIRGPYIYMVTSSGYEFNL